jgi:peptidoglycan/xylan/chitin deacetylase (PgdA/CDA1 family)
MDRPNLFSVALPMLNKLGIPATFFIITGDVAVLNIMENLLPSLLQTL